MTTQTARLDLSPAELQLMQSALRSFRSDFGHDEADVLERIQALLAKVVHAAEAVQATASPTAAVPE